MQLFEGISKDISVRVGELLKSIGSICEGSKVDG